MDLNDRIRELTSQCIGCKRCTSVCPSALKNGTIPHEIMASGSGDVSQCIMCGNCSRVCRKTDPLTVMKILRFNAFNGDFGDIYERTGFTMPKADINVPAPEWSGTGVTVMSGCVIKCRAPFLENATASALKAMGMDAKPLQNESCCIRPPMFIDIGKEMISSVDGELICLCPGCAGEYAPVKDGSVDTIEFLYRNIDRLPRSDVQLKVALETGCEATEDRDRMSAIVERMGFIDVHNQMGCCGKDVGIAKGLMDDRERECSEADVIVVACPKCFTEYDAYEGGKPVLYLMELIAFAAGDRSSLSYHRIKV